jgi:hypothetical protein
MSRSSDNTNYFKGYFNQPPGIADVGSYQVAGLPFISTGTVAGNAASDTVIVFPSVTKSLIIENMDDQAADLLSIHFGSTANSAVSNGRIITLPGGATALSRIVLDVKCKELFLSTPSGGNAVAYQVFAELTGIDTAQMIKINVADWPGVTSS